MFWLTAIQLGVVALLSIIVSVFVGDRILVWHQEIAWALAITVIYAYYAAEERLGMPGFVGAFMILAGMILSEIEAIGLPEK